MSWFRKKIIYLIAVYGHRIDALDDDEFRRLARIHRKLRFNYQDVIERGLAKGHTPQVIIQALTATAIGSCNRKQLAEIFAMAVLDSAMVNLGEKEWVEDPGNVAEG